MQLGRSGLVGAIAGVVLGGLVGAAGCEGAGDGVSGGDQSSELHGGFRSHRGHRGHDAGSVGGATGSGTAGGNGATTPDGGAAADCDICTQTQQCCLAVQDASGCSFSAAVCESEEGAARPAYVNACLVELNAIRGVWPADKLPAECR